MSLGKIWRFRIPGGYRELHGLSNLTIVIKETLYQINKQRGILCITVNVYITPFPSKQLIWFTPFLTSKNSPNHDKGFEIQPIWESLNSLMFLQCRISFIVMHIFTQNTIHGCIERIEQKGMTFEHDFGYSFHLFSSLLKKERRKRRMNSKVRDEKSCLSARSSKDLNVSFNEADLCQKLVYYKSSILF